MAGRHSRRPLRDGRHRRRRPRLRHAFPGRRSAARCAVGAEKAITAAPSEDKPRLDLARARQAMGERRCAGVPRQASLQPHRRRPSAARSVFAARRSLPPDGSARQRLTLVCRCTASDRGDRFVVGCHCSSCRDHSKPTRSYTSAATAGSACAAASAALAVAADLSSWASRPAHGSSGGTETARIAPGACVSERTLCGSSGRYAAIRLAGWERALWSAL